MSILTILTLTLVTKLVAKITHAIENGKLQFQHAGINFNGNSSETGALAYDPETNRDSNTLKGISVTGNLDYLDADAWRYVMKNLADGTKRQSQLSFKSSA